MINKFHNGLSSANYVCNYIINYHDKISCDGMA